jgi:hypothetical protein
LFCEKHDLDIDTFHSFTDAVELAHVDKSSIWSLLKKERLLKGAQQSGLSSLQMRCIDILARDFDSLEHGEEDPLRDQSAAFMYELIIKAKQCKRNVDSS